MMDIIETACDIIGKDLLRRWPAEYVVPSRLAKSSVLSCPEEQWQSYFVNLKEPTVGRGRPKLQDVGER